MATIDHTDILTGLYNFGTGDSSFNTAIGGSAFSDGRLRYGTAREGDTAPYVVYQMVDNTAFNSFDYDGFEIRVQFSIYDVEANGPDAVSDIADAFLARFQRADITATIPSHEMITPIFDQIRGPFKEDVYWRMDVDMIFRGFSNSRS